MIGLVLLAPLRMTLSMMRMLIKTTVAENPAVNKQNLRHEIEAEARKRCIPESEKDHHFSQHDDHTTTTRNMSRTGPMNALVHQ